MYDPSTGTWSPTGGLATARQWHTATLLPNGKVLVAGGFFGGSIASAELYNPATGTWSSTGSMSVARSNSAATLLPNGKVMVAGGSPGTNAYNASAELYDTASGNWNTAGSMQIGRVQPSATLLPNGKVLLAGGSTTGGISTASAELYDPASNSWSATGSFSTSRYLHSAVLLPNGKVLIVGGRHFVSNPPGEDFPTSVEVYDPTTGNWSATGSLNEARSQHTTTLLPSGKVLVAAGYNVETGPLSSAELYESASGSWSATGSSNAARYNHTATLLPTGDVLVAAGIGVGGYINSAELYHPSSGTWTNTGSLSIERQGHAATMLSDGFVLVTGGLSNSLLTAPVRTELYNYLSGTWSISGNLSHFRAFHTATLLPTGKVLVIGGFGSTQTAELYDPSSGTSSLTGAPIGGRWVHTATLLPNGKVLVVGGRENPGTAEVYDPISGTWSSTASPNFQRDGHTATLLPTGKVLVAGGISDTTAELYDPAIGTWTITGSMNSQHDVHEAVLLPNGNVLIAGGALGSGAVVDTELYDTASGTWSVTGNMANARSAYKATLLTNGRVLATGGYNGDTINSAELYDTGLNFVRPDWQPQVATATFDVGANLVLTGSRFQGISQASGGNDLDSSTNYPVVQLRSIDNSQVSFLPVQQNPGWSDTSFTSIPVNNFPLGPALVTVFTNGIPSDSKFVLVPSPEPTPPQVAITVTLPTSFLDPSVPSTTNIILPVTTTQIDPFPNPGPNPNPNPGDPGYVGFQADFTFDTTIVTFQAPYVQAAGLTGTSWNVSANVLSTGPGTLKTVRVSAFSLDFTPLSGAGTLYNLICRRVSNTPGNATPLTWKPYPEDFEFIDNDLNPVSPHQVNGLITINGEGATPTPTPIPPTPTPTPPASTPTPAPTGTPGGIKVTLPTTNFDNSVLSTTNVILPVITTQIDPFPNPGPNPTPNPGDPGYIGFQADFSFDSTIVTFQAPIVQAAGLTATNWNVSAGILGTGPIKILRVSAFSLDFTPLSGSGTLYNLILRRVSSTLGQTTPLTWQPSPNDFELIDQDLNTFSPTQNNGLITITGPGSPPTPTPPLGTPSPTPSPIPPTPTPTATATPPGPTPTPGAIKVTLPTASFDTSIPSTTNIILPVTTTQIDPFPNPGPNPTPNPGDPGYIGFQGDFIFDSTVVTFQAPFVQPAGVTGTNWNVSAGIIGIGPIKVLRVSAFSLDFTPLSGSGTFYNLIFRRVGSTGGTSLTWQQPPNDFELIDQELNTFSPAQNNGLITITGPTPTPPLFTPTPTPTPTAGPPTPTPCSGGIFLENFDGVVAPALPAGWVASNATNPDGIFWVTSTTTADSAPNDAFVNDPSVVSDKRLDTPNIAITSPGAQVSFRNNYSLEPIGGGVNYFDGAVLEVSSPNIAGGAFTDITDPAVGGSFVTGGYNGTISTSFSNPIGGRMAWGQSSGGYINTVANLGPNVFGQSIRLRFRMASDTSVAGTGWRIDNIVVSGACGTPGPTPTSPPGTPTPTPAPPTPTPNVSCPPTITQSSTQTITPNNSAACSQSVGGPHTDNSFWRAFNMASFVGAGNGYTISSVSFGIETADASGADQPITVRLYIQNGIPFPGITRTQIASATVNVVDQQLTILTVPITAFVPAGTDQLVMEVNSPDGRPGMNVFRIGSNTDPQTGLSYISAPDCGLNTPTDLSTIGFPNMHLLFNVNGNCTGTPTPGPTSTATPTPTSAPPTPTPNGSCPPTITQSSTQTITPGSVACTQSGTGFHTDNSYWRAFNMATFVGATNNYNITSVSFGIETANATAADQQIIVRLYTQNGTPFPGGTRTQIATATVNVADQTATVPDGPDYRDRSGWNRRVDHGSEFTGWTDSDEHVLHRIERRSAERHQLH